jgi:hypothetical protein
MNRFAESQGVRFFVEKPVVREGIYCTEVCCPDISGVENRQGVRAMEADGRT